MKQTRTILAALLLLLSPAAANAVLIAVNETIDISGYTSNNSIFSPITTETIASGDSVDMTVNFLPGQALHMGDGNEVFRAWFNGVGTAGNFTIENIVVEFLGFIGTGGASNTLVSASQSSGSAHLGPQFSNFLTAGQTIQLTGYRATYEVAILSADPNTYSNIWFLQASNNLSVAAVSVPEPATLSLFGAGLLGFGMMRRRRRTA